MCHIDGNEGHLAQKTMARTKQEASTAARLEAEDDRPGFAESSAQWNIEGLSIAPALRASAQFLATLRGLGYSQEEIHMLVVPRRTLARRAANDELLSVEETDKAVRLERVARQAAKIFGNPDKANRWMRKPKHQLGGQTPLAFLASEAGARIVEEMLTRIEYGMYA